MYPSGAAAGSSSRPSQPSAPRDQAFHNARDSDAPMSDVALSSGGNGSSPTPMQAPFQSQQQQQASQASYRPAVANPALSFLAIRRASRSPFMVAALGAEAVSPSGSDMYAAAASSTAAVATAASANHAPPLAMPVAQSHPRFSPYLAMHVSQTPLQLQLHSGSSNLQQHQQLRDAEDADGEFESGSGGGGGGEEETLISSAALDERSRHTPLSMEPESGDRQLLLDGHSSTPATPDDKSSPPLRSQQHPYAYGQQQSGLHHPSHASYFSPLSGAVAHAASSIGAVILPHSASPHKPMQLHGSMHSAQAVAEQHGASSARAIAIAAAAQQPLAPWIGKRAPVDLAGARKKDDSLQMPYGHSQHHSLSSLPLHLQQSALGVNHSLMGKLKAATQSVQVRVSRALSVGSGSPHAGPSNSLLMGGGGGGGSLGSGSGMGSTLPAPPSWLDRLRQSSVRRWKEVPAGVREKLLFLLSSLLGSLFFFVLFEAFSRFFAYNLDAADETIFTFSYVLAYLVSIVYQHMLNRLLIFRGAPYCQSLCHTFSVYSISLVLLTTLGGLLIRLLHANPRLIACFTLPASGLLNYYLLRYCMDGNLSMAPGDPAHSYAHAHHPALHISMTPAHKLERGLLITEKGPMGAGMGGGGGSGGSNSSGASPISALEAGHLHGHGLIGANPLSALGSPSPSPPTAGIGQVAGGMAGSSTAASQHAGGTAAGASGSGGGSSMASASSSSGLTVAQPSPYGNRRYTISSGSKGGHYGAHYGLAHHHHPAVSL